MEAIIAAVVNAITGPLIKEGAGVWKQYLNNEITEAQLANALKQLMVKSATDAYRAQVDAAFKMYDSFQQSLRSAKLIQIVWAIAVLSQLCFVLFLQFVVPALFVNGYLPHGWPVGTLDQWSMAFLGASLGIAPIVLKAPKPPTA